MLPDVPTVGENIRRLREAAGFRTQGAFAAALGVPQPRLSDWENDRYAGGPETTNLLKIAKTLAVSIDDLLVGVDPEYQRLIDARARRADPAHEKTTLSRTSSVIDAGVQPEHASSGGHDGVDETVRDRLPQPETLDAEVQRGIFNERRALELIARLTKSADAVRSVADDLRASLPTPDTRAKGSADGGSRPAVRRAAARRGRR